MLEIFAVALGGGGLSPRLGELALSPRDFCPGVRNRARVDLAKRIQQVAMTPRVEQAAIVMLPVDLHSQRTKLAKQSGRDRTSAGERAASTVALECTPDDQWLAVLRFDALTMQKTQRLVIFRQLELGRYGGTFLAGPHQPGIGPGT